MAVNRAVNPKKLRPYDEPPKRRRSLIPDSPSSAPTGFLVVAALWAAAAAGIGVLAIGVRAFGFEMSVPLGLFGLEFDVDPDRTEYAFAVATVYGWLTNAGIAAALFTTPRLVGRPVERAKIANLGLVLYNLSVALGVASLYFGELPPMVPLSALPSWAEIGMVLGLVPVLGAFVATLGLGGPRDRYVSTWFFAVALPALVGLTAANAALGFVALPAATLALASLYLERAVEAFWLFGAAVGTLFYVVPRASGSALHSGGLALLAWGTWVLLAGLTGLGRLVDTSVPFWVTTLGNVATMLLLVPAFLVVANLLLTMRGRWALAFGPGTLAFALVSLSFLLAVPVLQAILALRSVNALVGATEWMNGLFIFAAWGAYTFAMFALADHALPRLLRREWRGDFLASAQLWAAFGGATIAGLALMAGGLAQGFMIAQGRAPEEMEAVLLAYRAAAAVGFGLLALAGLALLVNAFLMYTSGRPAEYVIPTGAAPAAAH